MLRGVALTLLLVLASCGKVGDPLPPFIRIPEPVTDLAAVQSGYDLILTWTNPARYIDGSLATDLSLARIYSDGIPAAVVTNIEPGQPQSTSISARALIGSARSFSIQIETAKEKRSAISNLAVVNPVEVPGAVGPVRYAVDQNRITLEWDPPRENANLTSAYMVAEDGNPPAVRVTATRFVDEDYEAGKTYTYAVTAVRQAGPAEIAGVGGPGVAVTATDTTPPRVPAGLEITASDQGGFVTWLINEEDDLAGYRVFRSEQPDSGFTPLFQELRTTNGIFDPGYRPGMYYAVSAVDESGNESARSAAIRAQ